MSKRRIECTQDNCGDLAPRCGKPSTYNNHGCRCDPCRAAVRDYARRVRAADPEKFSERERRCKDKRRDEVNRAQRAAYAANRDQMQANARARYADNHHHREVVAECNRRFRRDNPNYHREKSRQFREANPGYATTKCREWRAANRESSRASVRKWAKAHPDLVRESYRRYRSRQLSASVIPFTQEQWEQKKIYWGSRCYLRIPGLCSGTAETMDHVKPLKTGSP